MRTADEWMMDMPQQFQGKRRIEVLIAAFARQLDELKETFRQLDFETGLDSAVGANLDMVGDILGMSRKDANEVVSEAADYRMTDGMYRNVLRYKALANSCACTYYDIMESVRLLSGAENISYSEPEDRPATVRLETPTAALDSMGTAIWKKLTVKPAGVSVLYKAGYFEKVRFAPGCELRSLAVGGGWKASPHAAVVSVRKDFDGAAFFDGSAFFDGRCGIDGADDLGWPLPVGISFRYAVERQSGTASVSVVARRNLWRFDGVESFSGGRLLDAMEKKEVL